MSCLVISMGTTRLSGLLKSRGSAVREIPEGWRVCALRNPTHRRERK